MLREKIKAVLPAFTSIIAPEYFMWWSFDCAFECLSFLFCRLERLEESLKDEEMSEATKVEKRMQHAVKETEFLRLRRSRLGVDDFDPIKVIGRGAFGEVSPDQERFSCLFKATKRFLPSKQRSVWSKRSTLATSMP